MQIRELTTDECKEMLQATNLGRLACVRYNRPYIVPVYFDYYEDALYSFATLGKKIQWMRTNPARLRRNRRDCRPVQLDDGRREGPLRGADEIAGASGRPETGLCALRESAGLVVPRGRKDSLVGDTDASDLPHSDRRR